MYFPYLIIGGGIAGVTCAETLHHLDENVMICLITASDTIKSVTNLHRITKMIEDFTVIDTSTDEMSKMNPNLIIIKGVVDCINVIDKYVLLVDNSRIHYGMVCICSGGQPKLIEDGNDYVVGIRDTESVSTFKERLTVCKKIAIVGNGGIATELVHEISDCELLWLIKDKTITSHFFDGAAAQFIIDSVDNNNITDKGAQKINKQRHHFFVDGKSYFTEKKLVKDKDCKLGGALGPDWAQNLKMKGNTNKILKIKYEVEVKRLETDPKEVSKLWQNFNPIGSLCEHKVALILTDDSIEFCDLVVSATGVSPQLPNIVGGKLKISGVDGGVLVGEDMCTNIEYVYAAGDCCTENWNKSKLWFQMRLWNQARTMAFQAAKCMFARMTNEVTPMLDFGFELFTHVTKFFGFSIIFLGLYNGQGLELQDNERAELLIRTSPNVEFIKCVLIDGRIQGAILIGDTEMAETLEDLILDQIDVSLYGENLLDPNIDIVDYFD